ncbi:MAG: hypothetical protein PHR46_04000 [Candidatus Absconditabacteria bacterium]|nr:hypothetical protein [Candidatus Absconditabacteria bacterium]
MNHKTTMLIFGFLSFLLFGIGYSEAKEICLAEEHGICTHPFESIGEVYTFLENKAQLATWDIKKPFPYTIFQSLNEHYCDNSSFKEGELLFAKLKSAWVSNIPSWKFQREMQRRFEGIKVLILGISPEDDKLLCTQKSFLYALLELSQQAYLGTLEAEETTDGEEHASAEEEPIETPQKEEILEENENNAVEEEVKEEVKEGASKALLVIQNNDETLSITDQRFASLSEKIIFQEVEKLVEKGFLDREDLERLDGKIQLNYVQQCGTTKGSYHMTQRKDGTDRKLTKIILNINICKDTTYLYNFDKYVRQIFIHEFAHYLYYFRDISTQTFDQLCRKDGENKCQSGDFVSQYAQQNKEEDYAESFTYWYLGYEALLDQSEHSSAESRIKGIKYRYFDRTFPMEK